MRRQSGKALYQVTIISIVVLLILGACIYTALGSDVFVQPDDTRNVVPSNSVNV